MSIEKAKATFKRACEEFEAARDSEDYRQASEKAWRAAREAVYAVMAAAGFRKKSTLSPDAIADFEVKFFRRDRSRGKPLADGYSRAMGTLHGSCFYDGECPPFEQLRRAFQRVSDLIGQAEFDVGSISRTRKKR